MINALIAVALLPAIVPLAMLALRLSKRHRNMAYMAAALLLMFGLNVKIDPPPPPHIEAVEKDEDEGEDAKTAVKATAVT